MDTGVIYKQAAESKKAPLRGLSALEYKLFFLFMNPSARSPKIE
jgi:hypothetical protein